MDRNDFVDNYHDYEAFGPLNDEGFIPGEEINPVTDLPDEAIKSNESSKSTLILDEEEEEIKKIRAKNRHLNQGEILPPEQFFESFLNCEIFRRPRKIFLVSTNSRIHGPCFRSKYGIFQERARHLSSFPWIIHPNSAFIWLWDILVVILLVATLLGQPILVAFYAESLHQRENILLQACLGIVFFLDIIINFRTGYANTKSDVIILDYTLVARHYFRTWFLIDLLSSIPYDFIYAAVHSQRNLTDKEEEYFKYLRLFELLKIFRLVRVIRYLTHIEEAFRIHSLNIRIINLLVLITFAIHWVACINYLVTDLANPTAIDEKKNMSWITRMNLWEEDISVKYLHCILRAVSNMVCLGYGNEVPKEIEDIVCTICSILLGALCFALFIGNITSILLNVNVAENKYIEVLNQVMEYMRFKQIPKDLQNRVVLYYEQRYRRNFFNEQLILASVSDVLREELQMCNCRALVEEALLFKGLPRKILYGIVSKLKFEVYLPMDEIISANTIGDAMFFIEHGAVSVLTPNGRIVSRLQDGDFFGEMSLVTSERRIATVIATNFCDIYRLDKADFHDAIEGYPEIYDSIAEMAQRRAGLNREANAQYEKDKDAVSTRQLYKNSRQSASAPENNENSNNESQNAHRNPPNFENFV